MNRAFAYITIFVFILTGIINTPKALYAVSPESISLNMSPNNPNGGETVSLSLSSYVANLDTVSITWFINGRQVSSGIGQKSFSTTAPAVGSSSTVRAVIALPDGSVEKSLAIHPAVLPILREVTDSYVPPFYRGKALPTAESQIKLVAIPEIMSGNTKVNSANLVYNWSRNYENEIESSGYGKNVFKFVKDYLQDLDNIQVTASTTDGSKRAGSSVNIGLTIPQISFYKNDNLFGIVWEQALKSGHVASGNEIIVAEPYYISPKEIWSPDLIWNWFINDQPTNNILPYTPNWIPISIEPGVSGSSSIGIQVENRNSLFGNVNRLIQVEY